MKNAAELIRASVRPVMAITSIAATAVFVGKGVDIPDAWWGIAGSVVTFYFVMRHDEKKNGSKTD